MKTTISEQEQIERDRKAFFAKYPKIKRSEDIKSLNLIMKREYAEAILKGEKTFEFRQYSPHYINRIFDKKLETLGETVAPEDINDFVDFVRPLRKVETVHFHDYNNTWFLDVECVDNWTVAVVDDEVRYLQDEFNCHELDDLLAELNAKKATERPMYFFFALGNVIDTNLNQQHI